MLRLRRLRSSVIRHRLLLRCGSIRPEPRAHSDCLAGAAKGRRNWGGKADAGLRPPTSAPCRVCQRSWNQWLAAHRLDPGDALAHGRVRASFPCRTAVVMLPFSAVTMPCQPPECGPGRNPGGSRSFPQSPPAIDALRKKVSPPGVTRAFL